MNFFKFFGAEPANIAETCVLLPSNDIALFRNTLDIENESKGMFFSIYNSVYCTFITMKNRWMAGDCVLMLSETNCRNIHVFGSCGAVHGKLGDTKLISKSYNLESFSSFLELKKTDSLPAAHPDRALLADLKKYLDIKNESICATVSSLVLEETKKEFLKASDIECFDMETSIVFSAAKKCCIRSSAVLYVTDVLEEQPFYAEYSLSQRQKINSSRKILSEKLTGFLKIDAE